MRRMMCNCACIYHLYDYLSLVLKVFLRNHIRKSEPFYGKEKQEANMPTQSVRKTIFRQFSMCMYFPNAVSIILTGIQFLLPRVCFVGSFMNQMFQARPTNNTFTCKCM